MSLRVLVVGAAAGGGLPQWNCLAPNSVSFWRGEPVHPPATQSSLAVSVDGADWALLNASPDLRSQILALPQLQPKPRPGGSMRDSPIRSVLLTNGDIDHVAGLLTLREKQSFTLYMTGGIAEVLDRNPIFEALDRDLVARRTVGLEAPFEILPGVTASLYPVPGKVPLFMEGAEETVVTDLMGEQTVGVEITDGSARVHYVPGCARVDEALARRLEGADLLLFDGTVWTDDEMPAAGVGAKTGRRMGHIPVSGPDGSMAALAHTRIGRRIFVHLNNTNPLWRRDGPERAEAAAAGWEIAHDGLEVVL